MAERDDVSTTREIVLAHVVAFNDHDTDRLLHGLHDGVIWATGTDVYRGRSSLQAVFDDGLWELQPSLVVERLVVEGGSAAMECVEHLLVGGRPIGFPIGVFLTVRQGLIAAVRVFRQGTAEIPGQ